MTMEITAQILFKRTHYKEHSFMTVQLPLLAASNEATLLSGFL